MLRRVRHKLSYADAIRFFCLAVLPLWSVGLMFRRRLVLAIAARFDWIGGAVRLCEEFRVRYGAACVEIPLPGRRKHFLVLSPAEASAVLAATPDPFTPATDEKTATLSHFEPCVSLISRGAERVVRRALSDQALEETCPVHSHSAAFAHCVEREASALLGSAREIDWDRFRGAWYRSVCAIVFGAHAAGDESLIRELDRLRGNGNWVFGPPAAKRRRAFHQRLASRLRDATPTSLAALAVSGDPAAEPTHQIAQWLFAFDAGAITVWNTLALLTGPNGPRRDYDRDFLRGAFLETLRLWPTTPAILRQAVRETRLSDSIVPRDANLVIFTPYLHRSPAFSEQPNLFRPERWHGKDIVDAAPFFPFSAGNGRCPGRHVVTLVATLWLAALVRVSLRATGDIVDPARPLPSTLSHFGFRFAQTAAGEETASPLRG